MLSADAGRTAHAPTPAVASALASLQRLDDLRVRPRYALIGAMSMPTLTRRRDPDAACPHDRNTQRQPDDRLQTRRHFAPHH